MPKRNVIWTIAIVAAGVVTVLLTRTTPPPAERTVPPVARAYQKIRDQWYFPPDEAALQQEAVRGMVRQLDEYSSYVAPDRIASFHARLDGRVRCVGLRVERVGGVVEIIGSLPGSPAHRASIEPGGRLVAIDGRSAGEYTDGEIRELLEAPDANTLKLTMIDALGQRRTCELAREQFLLETLTGLTRTPDGPWDYTLDADERIAYVRIKEFVPRTTQRLRQALRKLAGTRGIVLDLRDNPGGRIEVGYAVANLFLREGVVFTRIDRAGRRWPFPAHSAGTQRSVPMVVLINARTASAAELVAGALRLHDRAVLVGTRTCGKALVQSMLKLPGGLGQVNLTTAEFLVGADRRIARAPGRESWGVEPHRRVELTAAEDRAWRRFRAEMEVVPARGPASITAPATAPSTAPATRPARRAVLLDRQLAEAARLLAADGEVQAILKKARAERVRREKASELERATQPAPGAEPGGPNDDE